jgi:hypothetical protein
MSAKCQNRTRTQGSPCGLGSVAARYQIAEGMPCRVTDQREHDHKSEEKRHEAEHHCAGNNAAQSAIAFGFLRQVPTLIVTAVTTSIGSVISSSTTTAARALSCRL